MRIRTVKPELHGHPVMGRLDDTSFRLAIGLLNLADDEGYFYADAALIRSALRPYDEDSSKIRRSLEHLEIAGWVEVCQSLLHGEVGRVVNFQKHQRVDRPNPSKIKHYWDSTTIRRKIVEASTPEQGTGNKDQGKGQPLVNPPAEAVTGDDLLGHSDPKLLKKKKGGGPQMSAFPAFWEVYPRKVKRKEAFAVWMRLERTGKLPALDVLLAALNRHMRSEQWSDVTKIPHPPTWLNGERWNDEIETPGRVVLRPTVPVRPDREPPANWRELYRSAMGEELPASVEFRTLPAHAQKVIFDAKKKEKGGGLESEAA